MGESTNGPVRLQFDRRLLLEFHGATITSDAGLLACRELDDALGLTETATACLQESRGGRNVQHQVVPLLRQSVYSRLAGYEDANDAERLAQNPAMRVIVERRGPERQAASTNTMSRFETDVLTQGHNLEGLARMNAQWVDGAMAHTPHRRVILDMDSSESPVHGQQEGVAYNGHFESVGRPWAGCAVLGLQDNSRCGPTAASMPTPWSSSAARWMSASPSPSANTPASGS